MPATAQRTATPAPRVSPDSQAPLTPLWQVRTGTREKCFVDFQNDVTVADIALAAREGYTSVEHLKRYTTLGMGTDQGKLSNINGLAIQAQLLNAQIPDVGTTTFRPPYTPVTFGAIAGQERGPHVAPLRLSALDAWHVEAGATFINAGLWRRPQLYTRPGESDLDAVNREVRAVREHVGLVDVSTLGKIDIKGRDAAEFLERVYINNWKNLAVGKVRYGVMLREDGMVFDDGTTARIGEHHFVMTTTTANAVKVMSTLEYLLQVEWRGLEVYLTSVTEQWAAMALAGPDARRVLQTLAPEHDWHSTALPYMGYRASTIAGIPARVFRISFSGELAYEINVPADYARALWEKLIAAGSPFGITPYGTEAMGVLRIEKGHVAGMELDGRTTPDDLGLGQLVSAAKDCIGKRSLRRAALAAQNRKHLVGLLPRDDKTPIPRGAQLVADPNARSPNPILGHVTANCYSPTLGTPIALALLKNGRALIGQCFHAISPLAGVSRAGHRDEQRVFRSTGSARSWLIYFAREPACPESCRPGKFGSALPRAGITFAARTGLTLVDLRGDPQNAEFLASAQSALGCALPLAPNTSAAGADCSVLWLGPDAWLVVSERPGKNKRDAAHRARFPDRREPRPRRLAHRRRARARFARQGCQPGSASARVSSRALRADFARARRRAAPSARCRRQLRPLLRAQLCATPVALADRGCRRIRLRGHPTNRLAPHVLAASLLKSRNAASTRKVACQSRTSRHFWVCPNRTSLLCRSTRSRARIPRTPSS